MKLTTTILLCLFALSSMATDYYVSSATGSDANAGTSQGAAWQTISKVNSFSFLSGDKIYFKRGDTFYGTIVNNQNNITYGAYGTGNKPVLTGFTDVTSWTNLGGNIWESAALTTSLSYINMVTVNGINTAMGRTPNGTSLYVYQTASTNVSITSTSVNSGTIDWTGAQAIIRKNGWTTEKVQIASHSGNTITYSEGGAPGSANHGFFIQNDVRTLDVQNEWYFNPTTKKIRIYSTSSPTNIKVATLENIFTTPNNKTGITVQDLAFTGASGRALYNSNNSGGHLVSNCDISFAGDAGIYFTSGSKATVNDNTISNTNGPAIWFYATDTVSVYRNTITNAGVFLGAALHPHAIMLQSANSDIGYNVIKNVGRAGVEWNNGIGRVHHNFIDSFGLSGNDVGGIYLDAYRSGIRLIDSNIVLNGLGYTVGTPYESQAEGIYLDEQAENVIVKGNTLAGNGDMGIKLHMAHGVSIIENTGYNNGMGLWNTGAGIGFLDGYGNYLRDINVKRNVFVAKKLTQYALNYITKNNDINLIGTSDSNYFAKPIQDTKSFVLQPTIPGSQSETNLAGWKTASGQDSHSYTATKTVTHVDSLRFEYNASSTPKVVSLGQKYVDVKGTIYNGSITVPAWSSVVLLKDGATVAPVGPSVNAGPDQIIRLPVNSVSLSATIDTTGPVISQNWFKFSGGAATLTATGKLTATVTGMVEGEYNFGYSVQQDGEGASDYMKVTVLAAAPEPVPGQVLKSKSNVIFRDKKD